MGTGWLCRARYFPTENTESILSSYVRSDYINLDAVTEPYSLGTIRFMCDCATSSIAVEDLRAAFNERPEITRELYRWLTWEQDTLRMGIGILTNMTTNQRARFYLLGQYMRLLSVGDHNAIDGRLAFPMTQTELGKMMGVTNVHISRAFKELRDEGILEYLRGNWTVIDVPKLKKSVEASGVSLSLLSKFEPKT